MNDFMNSLPRAVAWVIVFLSSGLGAAAFFAVLLWIVNLLTRWTNRDRVAVKDQAGFQSPPVGCDTSAARQPVRIVPWHKWKESLEEFVSGRITLDEHIEKFSGCIIGKKPEPKRLDELPDDEWKEHLKASAEWKGLIGEPRYVRPYPGSLIYGFRDIGTAVIMHRPGEVSYRSSTSFGGW